MVMMAPEQMAAMHADAAEKSELQAHLVMISKRAADLARESALKDARLASLERENATLRAKVAGTEKAAQSPGKRKREAS